MFLEYKKDKKASLLEKNHLSALEYFKNKKKELSRCRTILTWRMEQNMLLTTSINGVQKLASAALIQNPLKYEEAILVVSSLMLEADQLFHNLNKRCS